MDSTEEILVLPEKDRSDRESDGGIQGNVRKATNKKRAARRILARFDVEEVSERSRLRTSGEIWIRSIRGGEMPMMASAPVRKNSGMGGKEESENKQGWKKNMSTAGE